MIQAASLHSRLPVIAAALVTAAPACAGATAEERSQETPRPPAPTAPAEPAGRAPPAPLHGAAEDGGPGEARAPLEAAAAPAPERSQPVVCTGDADCGYDPANERCGTDPRLNRQPPLIDQGVVCYCEAGACSLLRVVPVPCEGDHSCAVAHEPRPHPVRATRERPHEKGRPCRDFTLSTTCERTNICTLRRHVCPAR
ncbi:uncharacterized protein SOCE26_087790 [Sorangium cellulosum]|uniref:Secreted protein n=1 Tax=Sorangium cellulosum TaxID=56 RepID=A0A2L0F6X9_SORCE|nr:hypothetical protein [Sorangium cellulosum]AUX47261.1 uncharacterized protein SOCE26_087790 [Sorangium cellulosum]